MRIAVGSHLFCFQKQGLTAISFLSRVASTFPLCPSADAMIDYRSKQQIDEDRQTNSAGNRIPCGPTASLQAVSVIEGSSHYDQSYEPSPKRVAAQKENDGRERSAQKH